MASIAGCADDETVESESESESDSESDSEMTAVASDAQFHVDLVVDETRRFFEARHVNAVGSVNESETGRAYLTISLTGQGVETATDTAVEADLGERYDDATIVPVVDGDELNRFGVAPSLATTIAAGEWDGLFRLTFDDREWAVMVHRVLVGDPA